MGRRTSVIWQVSDDEFAQIVRRSNSIREALAYWGLHNKGGNFRTFRRRVEESGLNLDHFETLQPGWHAGRSWAAPMVPLDQILVEHSKYSRRSLKRRLIKEGILKNRCSICDLGPKWNGKPLVLRLDHENGIYDDARLPNLRLVCPNCDSQLETFCGKNTRNSTLPKCQKCEKRLTAHKSRLCQKCSRSSNAQYKQKIVWPTDDELLRMVQCSTKSRVAEQLGVSGTRVGIVIKRILADRLTVGQTVLAR